MMNLTNMRIGKRLASGFGISRSFWLSLIAVNRLVGEPSVNAESDKALDEGAKLLLTYKTACSEFPQSTS